MLDFSTFADLLLRGAESARRDARAIADELRERGDLSAEEARALVEAVGKAASAGRGLLLDVVATPLRRALEALGASGETGAADESEGAEGPLTSLDARLAELEARLDALAARRGE